MEAAVRFSETRGTVTVTTTLYGPVDEARYDREHKEAGRRADQLGMTWPRPGKRWVPRDSKDKYDYSQDWD